MPKISIIRYIDQHDLNSYPMLGLGYMKSFVEHHLPNAVEFEYLENDNDLQSQNQWDADMYAFTALSQDYEDVIRMAKFVRTKTDAPFILGGSHISFLANSLHPIFDAGALGDGEPTMLAICRMLDSGIRMTSKEYAKIPGLVYWKNSDQSGFRSRSLNVLDNDSQLCFSPPSPGIQVLDNLPFPDRRFGGEDLLPHLLSSRGCPFTCSFCTSSQYWKKFRSFSADYIKAEIVAVADEFAECDFLPFWDDLFIANRRRFAEVVNMLEQTRLNQIFSFSCGVRVDLVDKELCELLKRGNFGSVFFGLESGSNRILKWLKGGKVSVERMQEALDLLHKYGIAVAAPFIVGIPTEEEKDLLETYEFVIRNMSEGKLQEAQSHVMCPMPGTQIWAQALKGGYVTEKADFEWGRMRYYSGWRNYVVEGRKRGDFSTWVNARKQNQSLYINECYTQDRMFEIIEPFEMQIDSMGSNWEKY